MEKKTKRTLLGIQKNNKKSTKRKKQTFFKNVVDYLRADSYLFGPLVSPSPFEFGALKFSASSSTGVKIKEPIGGTKKKFIGKVMEYLKSDDYMYSSLVYGPLTISGGYRLQCIRSFPMDISTMKLTTEENQPTVHSANVMATNQPFKDSSRGMSNPPSNQTSWNGETVKHMVYHNCRSSSVSGKQMMESQIGELFIE